jgi:hypothetical protein
MTIQNENLSIPRRIHTQRGNPNLRRASRRKSSERAPLHRS